jgi:hypothetical protein
MELSSVANNRTLEAPSVGLGVTADSIFLRNYTITLHYFYGGYLCSTDERHRRCNRTQSSSSASSDHVDRQSRQR